MNREVRALFVHGVGTQTRGYSDESARYLSAALSKVGFSLYAQEVHWAPVLDVLEREFLDEVKRRGSDGRPMQRLVIETLSDALCYRNRVEDILALVDAAYLRLRSDRVHVFAHSLGGLIATDWLRSRQKAKIEKLITFGCNLQLFSLGTKWPCPEQVAEVGDWVNCFDPEDMLGFPLGGWQRHVRDVQVSVGGLFTGWNGLAHVGYFGDSSFWGETIPRLL